MGQPKLTLELGGQTVLSRLAGALNQPEIVSRVIVIRSADAELTRHAESLKSLTILHPKADPPDMRQSVQFALDDIQRRFAPSDDAGWLLVPADHPCLSPQVLRRLIDGWIAESPEILVPTFQGKRGHPTFFRWRLAAEVRQLPADRGLNQLLKQHAGTVRELPFEDPGVLADLDTPEDYNRLQRRFGEEQA